MSAAKSIRESVGSEEEGEGGGLEEGWDLLLGGDEEENDEEGGNEGARAPEAEVCVHRIFLPLFFVLHGV